MASNQYGDIIETIDVYSRIQNIPANKLDEITINLAYTNKFTGSGSSISFDEDRITPDTIFVFNSSVNQHFSGILLYPQDIRELSEKSSKLYEHYYKNGEGGLFIPDRTVTADQCSVCGEKLTPYNRSDLPLYDNDGPHGYLWSMEFDRQHIFHGDCLTELTKVLEDCISEYSHHIVLSGI